MAGFRFSGLLKSASDMISFGGIITWPACRGGTCSRIRWTSLVFPSDDAVMRSTLQSTQKSSSVTRTHCRVFMSGSSSLEERRSGISYGYAAHGKRHQAMHRKCALAMREFATMK